MIIIALLLLLSSCSHLFNKSELISIDSSPRGAEVTLQNSSKVLGVTPFFYNELPNQKQKYSFKIQEIDGTIKDQILGEEIKKCTSRQTIPITDKIPNVESLFPEEIEKILRSIIFIYLLILINK